MAGGRGALDLKPKPEPKEAPPRLEKEKRGEAKVGPVVAVFLAASVSAARRYSENEHIRTAALL